MMPYYKYVPAETFGDKLYRGLLKFYYRATTETPEKRQGRIESVKRHQPSLQKRLKEAILEWYV